MAHETFPYLQSVTLADIVVGDIQFLKKARSRNR